MLNKLTIHIKYNIVKTIPIIEKISAILCLLFFIVSLYLHIKINIMQIKIKKENIIRANNII